MTKDGQERHEADLWAALRDLQEMAKTAPNCHAAADEMGKGPEVLDERIRQGPFTLSMIRNANKVRRTGLNNVERITDPFGYLEAVIFFPRQIG